jgi:hypothetical protein
VLPIGRAFFELEPLPAELVAALGLVAIAWTALVLLVRRTGVVQRGLDGWSGSERAGSGRRGHWRDRPKRG